MRSSEDVQKIKKLIDSLCQENPSIDKNIPRYLYHFTDIENVVGILSSGFLYSRNAALHEGIMINDNASEEVIGITNEENKDYVRLYFRPKTPTQYRNEGIKSEHRSYEILAHCPIPIFLLFDGEKVLSDSNTKFVEKNLALNPPKKSRIDDLLKFDFDKIFHNGPTGGDRDIIEKRHAEVLIYEKYDLTNLKLIVARSEAERETLLNMIEALNIDLDTTKFLVDRNSILYHKSRAYIDYVELEDSYIKIGFSGFYTLKEQDEVILELNNYLEVRKKIIEPSKCKNGLRLNLGTNLEDYELQIKVNSKTIYLGKFRKQSNLPF